MTLQGAIDTAAGMFERFGKAFQIYRMPAWPENCYAVMPKDCLLPMEAQIHAVIAEMPEPAAPQGSLF